jgi:hypothetical protein
MDDFKQPDVSNPDESLANLPPVPMRNDNVYHNEPIIAWNGFLTTVVVIGGAGLLVGLLSPSVQGATRSAKLVWQQHQTEIQRAEYDASSCDQRE